VDHADEGLVARVAECPMVEHLDIRTTDIRGMGHLERLRNLTFLRLDGRLEDDALLQVAQLPSLRTLVLHASITDAELEHIATMRQLESLELSGLDITGEGFRDFANLANLKRISLENSPRFSDEGVRHLSRVGSLEELSIRANITDASISDLTRMPNLRDLKLVDAEITAGGLERLRAKIPRVSSTFIHRTGESMDLSELFSSEDPETKDEDLAKCN
jgi:hypothetical protein